jgi:hypothetical protein
LEFLNLALEFLNLALEFLIHIISVDGYEKFYLLIQMDLLPLIPVYKLFTSQKQADGVSGLNPNLIAFSC